MALAIGGGLRLAARIPRTSRRDRKQALDAIAPPQPFG